MNCAEKRLRLGQLLKRFVNRPATTIIRLVNYDDSDEDNELSENNTSGKIEHLENKYILINLSLIINVLYKISNQK